MKKILSIVATAILAFTATGCTDEMKGDFVHDDATISSITMQPGSGSSSLSVSGVIDQEAGTILFTVPKAKRKEIDISQVRLRANIGLDAKITPSLSGWQDLSSPMEITVTATMTGTTKKYTLSATYEK